MGRALLRLSATCRTLFVSSLTSQTTRHLCPPMPIPNLSLSPPRTRVFLGLRPLCSIATATATTAKPVPDLHPAKHSLLLDRLRSRHHKAAAAAAAAAKTAPPSLSDSGREGDRYLSKKSEKKKLVSSFEELGLSEEVMKAVREMGISVPTEIQCIGVPAVLDGTSVVMGSHTGSGKTLAYMLPIVQMLRNDEALFGMLIKPRRPRAVVLCPTRELCEQVFRVAKSISHHARFRSAMVSGGGRLRPQEDSLNTPIDMIVGTPGRVLQHIEEGNIVYGDIKYLVLDESDTMFDQGFGPDIRKFIGPLTNRALKSKDQGYQKVLVAATITKAVQKLVDEEFPDITHLRTSSLHKKIASAHHNFIKLSGSENKLDALLQVLEPSLSKGNRVMVFCNTLNSSRAVDHFVSENNIYTVNYHGEVPAEERVENLKKFKSPDGDCPTLVCTDLAARGLDLDVDHVIMFDFPLNSIDYLHRTGRTARMGAKGKVTSLVARKDLALATRIEEAIKKNESLEHLSLGNVRRDIAEDQISNQRRRTRTSPKPLVKAYARRSTAATFRKSSSAVPARSWKTVHASKSHLSGGKKKTDRTFNSARLATTKRSVGTGGKKQAGGKFSATKSTATTPKRNVLSAGKKQTDSKSSAAKANPSKLSVVGFRGRSSLFSKK